MTCPVLQIYADVLLTRMPMLLRTFPTFAADCRIPTFQTSLLHCITLSKRVYSRVMNMADGICPTDKII